MFLLPSPTLAGRWLFTIAIGGLMIVRHMNVGGAAYNVQQCPTSLAIDAATLRPRLMSTESQLYMFFET